MPFNSIFAWIIKKRIHQIELFKKYPLEVQEELFDKMIQTATGTEFGTTYHFNSIKKYSDFKKQVPLHDYESLDPYIERLRYSE